MKLFCKKQNLMKMCNIIFVITVMYAFIQLFYLTDNLIHNGFVKFLSLEMIPQNNNALAVIAVSVMFFMLARNVKRGEIFVEKNEKILLTFGRITGFIGLIFYIILMSFAPDNVRTSNFPAMYSGMILTILLGLALVFFSLIMKIGRTMREENELTV